MRTFGDALIAARKKAKLTQEQLAERLGHKGQSTVSSLEQRRFPPRPETVEALATALGCPWRDLLHDVETEFDAYFSTRGSPGRRSVR